jgi:hypothetical protein
LHPVPIASLQNPATQAEPAWLLDVSGSARSVFSDLCSGDSIKLPFRLPPCIDQNPNFSIALSQASPRETGDVNFQSKRRRNVITELQKEQDSVSRIRFELEYMIPSSFLRTHF